jgi:hypothetical protein
LQGFGGGWGKSLCFPLVMVVGYFQVPRGVIHFVVEN